MRAEVHWGIVTVTRQEVDGRVVAGGFGWRGDLGDWLPTWDVLGFTHTEREREMDLWVGCRWDGHVALRTGKATYDVLLATKRMP